MHENELKAFLRSRIPLSAAMAVEVRTASPAAVAPDAADWAKFRATLARNRTARIRVGAWIESGGERAGELEGVFAVLPAQPDDTRTDA